MMPESTFSAYLECALDACGVNAEDRVTGGVHDLPPPAPGEGRPADVQAVVDELLGRR